MKKTIFAAIFAGVLFATSPAHAYFLIPVAVAAALGTVGTAILATVLTVAGSMALNMIMGALFAKPAPSGGRPGQDSGHFDIDQQQSTRQAVSPRRVIYGKAAVGGVYALQEAINRNQYLLFDLMFAGHEVNAFLQFYMDDTLQTFTDETFGNVTSGRYAGLAQFWPHLGTDDQEADSYLMSQAPSVWTATDRLQGIAHVAGSFFWDNVSGNGTVGQQVWNGNFPNTRAVIEGAFVYDPRLDDWVYSNNSALIVAEYLTNTRYGRGAAYPTGAALAVLIASANVCDEEVALQDGSTEARYATDGSFLTDRQPDDVLGQLLGAMHGAAVKTGDDWYIYAGAWQTPTITLTDDDMAAPSKLATLTSGRDSFNSVKGTYIGPDNGWVEADFPPIRSAAFITQDQEIEQWKDINLPFTISATRAQRIAKIYLLRGRQEIVETFTGKLSCYRVRPGTIIYRDSVRYGWNQKPFEVTSARIAVQGGDNPVIVMTLTLIEIAEDVFDWNTSEESAIDPEPDTNFPNVFPDPPLPPFQVVESLERPRDSSGWHVKAAFSWTASDDSFVTSGGGYLLRYRAIGASAWTYSPLLYDPKYDLMDIETGDYEAELRSVSWAEHVSEDSLYVAFHIVGFADPPQAPANLNVVPMANGTVAHATWDESTEPDVLFRGIIQFRHSALLSGATWADGITISRPLNGDTTETFLPLKTGTYMAKFKDASGHWSESFASFVQTQTSSIWDFIAADTIEESPAFSGTKVDCAAPDGVLQLAGSVDVDDVADWDLIADFDYTGGVTPLGTYTAADILNFGAVTNVRITSIVDYLALNVFDSFDDRDADVDDWPDFDGEVRGDEADVVFYLSTTNDNPAGSPVWSAWQRFATVEARCYAAKIKADLISRDSSFTPYVSAFGAIAETVV